ncbi:MAG: SDR family oxidoreductase [Lentisphaeria bacterium]|nr:SDR family oxidoreductase [Lentisphaeria bacterium]
MFKLVPNSTIVITGASSGIGREVAIRCAQYGTAQLLIGRNQQALEDTAKLFPTGIIYDILEVDLANCNEIKTLLNEKCKNLPPISGFVSCAGISATIPLKFLEHDELQRTFNINATSGFSIAGCLASPKKISSKGASFVFISSATAHRGFPGLVGYSASKGALLSGVKAMAAELAPLNIRCNSVSPGFVIDTGITKKEFELMPHEAKEEIKKQHPLGLGKTTDVAAVILFLLSAQARWITGTDIVVDGGFSI